MHLDLTRVHLYVLRARAGGEKIISIAIEKKRVAGKPVVLLAIHSPEPREKQEAVNFMAQHFKLTPYKKGPFIVENVDSVVPVKRSIEGRFPNVRFVSMVEMEILGAY